MSGYENFAVIGSGSIGKDILRALLDKKDAGAISSITLLSRSPQGHDEFIARGVKLEVVNYSSDASIRSALSGIDVVISVVGNTGIERQAEIAKIAKEQGVKLFVPSEWGAITDGATEGFFAAKDKVKARLRELGLPYTAFYTGCWSDWHFGRQFGNLIGFDLGHGKVDLYGTGNVEIPFVSRKDSGRFVAHVLTTLPREELEWRAFAVVAEKTTWNRIIAEWEKRSGKQVVVKHHPVSEAEEALAKNPQDPAAFLRVNLNKGTHPGSAEVKYAADVWPEWNPQTVVDTIAEIYV